jgi:uncharacterized protein
LTNMPTPITPLFPWQHRAQGDFQALLDAHVAAADFPCVGAKAALAKGTLSVLACDRIDSAWDDLRIHDGLLHFAKAYREQPSLFRSFAVIFDGPDTLSEEAFEAALWERAQSLSDKDVWRGQGYDRAVSADPESAHFSLSFGGEAFFIVGLHPRASRPARGCRYEGMREKILVRDEALAGSRNPMLARHGDASEARQYSGRAVEDGWKCPFHYSGSPE